MQWWDGTRWGEQTQPQPESEIWRPGWYPNGNAEKWWDGMQWTDKSRPLSQALTQTGTTEPADLIEQLDKVARRGIQDSLQSGEVVRVIFLGYDGCALVGTDRRVFVFKKGPRAAGGLFSKKLSTWEYKSVSGIQHRVGTTSQALVVEVPGVAPVTATGRMDRGSDSAWGAPNALMVPKRSDVTSELSTLRGLITERQQPASAAQSSAPDTVEEIKRYAALRDSGVISAEDFETKKRQLMGI
jgi:hypothetical protein